MAHATTCVSGPLLVIVGGSVVGGVLSVTVGLVTSLQSSGRRYSVCILDTFKIGLILYTFFSYPSLTL